MSADNQLCYVKASLREGLKKINKQKVDQGRTLEEGGSGKIFAGPQFYCEFWKIKLGGNLIVQLCIFSCKDKAILGYNVLVMYVKEP